MTAREKFLILIKENIEKFGYHITCVIGNSQNPPFAYTIGLYEKIGFELAQAGNFISNDINSSKFSRIVAGLNSGLKIESIFLANKSFQNEVDLKLLEMHTTWKELMTLGVFDYHCKDDIKVFQIIPKENILKDVPNMSKPWRKELSVWGWLNKEWNATIPISSYVRTNVDFLKGATIMEMVRWENDYWDMFAGKGIDLPEKDLRFLPISTMLDIDDSLNPAVNLSVGEGLWREDAESEWKVWS